MEGFPMSQIRGVGDPQHQIRGVPGSSSEGLPWAYRASDPARHPNGHPISTGAAPAAGPVQAALAEEAKRVEECKQLYAEYERDYGPIVSDDGTENALVRAIRIGQSAEAFDAELSAAVGESTTA